jgi:cell division protein FtsZ
MSNPLIEDPSIKRASGLIISITGGKDMMLYEVDEAVTRIREEADADANIIVGASFDDSMEGIVRVSVVATGIDNLDQAGEMQPGETSLTELATRMRNDGNADQVTRAASLPQVESPPLRPAARATEGRPARPISENARHAMPQGLAAQGPDAYRRQASAVPHAIEDDVFDIPAFLRRKAN